MVPTTGWIDSFVMAAAMAISGCPRVYRCQAVFGFMAFDFLASCAALPFSTRRAMLVLFAFALSFVLIYAGKKRPVLYALVPLLCSLDNLLVAGDGPFQWWSAAAEGIASGALAWAGFWLGSVFMERMKGGVA